MIYGIGTDIIQISRVAAALSRHGDRFAEKVLGQEELAKYKNRKNKVEARGIRFLATDDMACDANLECTKRQAGRRDQRNFTTIYGTKWIDCAGVDYR